MRATRRTLCAAFVASLAFSPVLTPAFAQSDRIGVVKTQTGTVHIERGGQRAAATVGAPVFRNDRIVTGRDGSVGVTFPDNAMLSAGPNSVLVLDQYRFDPSTHEGAMDVSIQRGTLSAIAGKLVETTPGSMRVRTPSAVLAVRGTEFVVRVEPVGE